VRHHGLGPIGQREVAGRARRDDTGPILEETRPKLHGNRDHAMLYVHPRKRGMLG